MLDAACRDTLLGGLEEPRVTPETGDACGAARPGDPDRPPGDDPGEAATTSSNRTVRSRTGSSSPRVGGAFGGGGGALDGGGGALGGGGGALGGGGGALGGGDGALGVQPGSPSSARIRCTSLATGTGRT